MKSLFQQINVLFLALTIGQILFAVVVIFLGISNGGNAVGYDAGVEIFDRLIPLLLLFALGGAYLLSKKRNEQGAAIEDLQARGDHYRTTFLIRSALLEGVNVMILVAMLLVSYKAYLFYFAVGFLAFLYYRPSTEKFIRDYQLDPGEQQEVRNGKI